MSENEFDRFAGKYDAALVGAMPPAAVEDAYFAEYKVAYMAQALPRAPRRILDFGCGTGRSLPWLKKYFPEAQLWGYDLSKVSLQAAHDACPDATLVSQWDDLIDVRFDAVLAANVFHHIPPLEQLHALSQCCRVLEDFGEMFLFEHNPSNPATRWVFERCPFDVDAKMIGASAALAMGRQSGFRRVSLEYTLFFPRPLAFFRPLERWMRKIPLGAQYCVCMGR
ncbi:MAG: class I SAM-dependent methyltransferase [Undibacterium sp.]|uniref:class I SAM-dependent methyltransferase n=1 Tax=Undibacterium sp. TaxID=1914977 RepID=UPI00271B2AE5|nr:class I SAM-dependent methyltransferase [Undibacterium sp.]MDO8652457.1 class I SAM-dependent methyltransferase [Undibacterium sp.]